MATAIRLDQITAGSILELELGGRLQAYETVVFLGVTGDGELREAEFVSASGDSMQRWSAYRHKGRWAYGSSASRLTVFRIVDAKK